MCEPHEYVDLDSEGVYFCSVEEFEGQPSAPGPTDAGSTLAIAVDALTARGYRGDLRAGEGVLRDPVSRVSFSTDKLIVDEMLRFDADSDPADQSILLAISTLSGAPFGTYVVSFGHRVSSIDADVLSSLRDRRDSKRSTTCC